MDTDTLVGALIASGWRLIEALELASFDVKGAAWVMMAENARWNLYIVSKVVDEKGPIASYRALADVLRQTADPRLSVSDVKLIGEGQRIAKDLLEIQCHQSEHGLRRANLTSLGGEPVEAVYMYPAAQYRTVGPKESVLRFMLRLRDDPPAIWSRFHPNGKMLLNRAPWRGKEPRSCAITSIKSGPHAVGSPDLPTHNIEVSYRPKGCITYSGGTRYDGWTLTVLDRAKNGDLLDGQGKPLAEGQPPVYLRYEVYEDVDFNEMDFGEFVGEVEAKGVRHFSFEDVTARIHHSQSGRFRGGLTSFFVAPRRHRPSVKIMLSDNPSGNGFDGFGTLIFNVNKSTPQLQQVILDHITELINGFVEGRYSIKNMSNYELVYVELDDLLVDWAPNPEEVNSRFNCLHKYLPDSYLDELAMRLVATYEVDASVVDGPKFGLLLRRSDQARRD